MLKNRLVVCLLLRNGVIVQSKGFRRYQHLGNPTTIVQRLSHWTCDELVYLDITPGAAYTPGRRDLKHAPPRSVRDVIADVGSRAFMPLTIGGRVRTMDDFYVRLHAGADKVAVNTQALETPALLTDAARHFGSQCVVVSIDCRRRTEGDWEVFSHRGAQPTGRTAMEWVREVEARGAGEIFLTSIDRDGSGEGYDLDLIRAVCQAVTIPVIACGGAGEWAHLAQGLKAGASAVAAANIFHYTENSVYHAKQYLYEHGCNVRPPEFSLQHLPSEVIG